MRKINSIRFWNFFFLHTSDMQKREQMTQRRRRHVEIPHILWEG